MKKKQQFSYYLKAFVAVIAISLFSIINFTSVSVFADGESGKWNDANNIELTGGNLAEPVVFSLTGTPSVNGYSGKALLRSDSSEYTNCYRFLYLSWEDPTNDPRHPTIYSNPIVQDSIGQPSGTRMCNQGDTFGGKSYADAYQNITITLSNDRPGGDTGGAQETDAQKTAPVRVCSFVKGSPKNITLKLTKDGKTYDIGISGTITDNPPPPNDVTDDNPINFDAGCYGIYETTITQLEAGNWKLCTTIKGQNACQTFKKEKYKASDRVVLEVGTEPESPSKKVMEAIIRIQSPDITSLNQSQSLGVYDIVLKDGSGKVVDKASVPVDYNGESCNDAQQDAQDAGTSASCQFPGTASGYHEFKNVKPGNYQICIADSEKCISVKKERDTRSRNNILSISMEEAKEYDTSGVFDGTNGQSSCTVEGIGWLICPVMNFMAELNDQAFGFLSSTFLEIDPQLLTGDTKAAWNAFRDLANVLFVIGFLIIIYSQITGTGISNYGVKKMLPKLIVVAVLVNVSYYLCLLAVDVSNIVGNQIASFLGTGIPVVSNDTATTGNTNLPLWKDVTGALLVGAAIGVGLVLLFAIGLPILLAFAMIVIILIARKALIILLVATSPIAFVAYLLPNTESIFKKWWSLFKSLLLLYPIIGVVFGASTLAATIIASSDDKIVQLTALGVVGLPLFAVPVLLKGALSATGQLGSKLSNLSDRANKRAMGNIKNGRSGEFLAARSAAKQKRQINRRTGNGFVSKRARNFAKNNPDSRFAKAVGVVGSPQTALDNSRVSKFIGADRGAAAAQSAALEEYNKEVKRQKDTMSSLTHDQLMDVVRDSKASTERRAAAAGTISTRNYRKGHQDLIDYIGDSNNVEQGRDSLQTIQQQTAYDMKSMPTGMGDTDKSELGEGRFSKTTGSNAAGEQRTVSQQVMLDRLHNGKISAQTFASLDPDDLKLIQQLKDGNHLTSEAQTSIDNVIDSLRRPENSAVYANSKDNARAIHDVLHS